MKRFISVITLVLSFSVAGFLTPSAFGYSLCHKPSYYMGQTFEDQTNGYIEYLICLHNEQVDAINSLNEKLSSTQYGDSVSSDAEITELYGLVNDLAKLVQVQHGEIIALKVEVETLKVRVGELEAGN